MSNTTNTSSALNSAIKKTWRRLIPLMFSLYFVAFIDRVNVGFAKEAMSVDIGLSQSAFALGAGIFFAAYAIFGIPANLMMNKLGAKVWLSATTAVWGPCPPAPVSSATNINLSPCVSCWGWPRLASTRVSCCWLPFIFPIRFEPQ